MCFLLVDAINDDTRFLPELRFDLGIPYEGFESEFSLTDVREGLVELLEQNYARMELVTDPDGRTLKELALQEAVEILNHDANWSILENATCFAVSTKDGKRTIQLENALNKELRSLGVSLVVRSH